MSNVQLDVNKIVESLVNQISQKATRCFPATNTRKHHLAGRLTGKLGLRRALIPPNYGNQSPPLLRSLDDLNHYPDL
jgi:hypothetical protein